MNIKSIQVGELISYIQSEEFLHADFWPISPVRAISHAMNPRADKDDTSLLLVYDSADLVGYLGLLPDLYFHDNGPQKIFWISCMWIKPEYRRKGMAMNLLEKAYEICNGNIFISNYIPRSKSAFIGTTYFVEHSLLCGIRAYIFFDLTHILINKKPGLRFFQPLFYLADTTLNLFFLMRIKLKIRKLTITNRYIAFHYFEKNINDLINRSTKNSMFRRDAEIFQWMVDFPWVKDMMEQGINTDKYYFSQYSRDFRQYFIKITDTYQKVIGFFMLTLHKGVLKVPYIFASSNLVPDIAIYLIRFMADFKIPVLVTHHSPLVREIEGRRKIFLHQRKSKYGLITTKKIADKLEKTENIFYEGDGDGAFT